MDVFKFKYQFYRHLYDSIPKIMADIDKAAVKIGIPSSLKGSLGLSGSNSGCPGILLDAVAQAMFDGARRTVPNKVLDDRVRQIVKEYYGDDYDAVVVNTCDAALKITLHCLVAPPRASARHGNRVGFITPLERHILYVGAFGSPYPARYKDFLSDKSTTGGEYGLTGKALSDLDAIITPLAGARYDVHGIKYFPTCLLRGTKSAESVSRIEDMARAYPGQIAAIVSLGYDTPGYGYGERSQEGAPLLQVEFGKLARRLGIPYIVDNANGAPFVGTDIRKIGADVMCYSMDKVSRAPTAGLIIGREEHMVPIRRAAGVHGERSGAPSSHGVAAFCMHDPGRHALLGVIAALEVLRERPEMIPTATDQLYEIVAEEFSGFISRLGGVALSRSYNGGFVEVNYEATWDNGSMGLPIFTAEDSLQGTDLIAASVSRLGVVPGTSYDANIVISTGIGTIDGEGKLLADETRLAVRSLVAALEVIGTHAGVW